MKVVSVILARGGSKGIPRKNIKDLCGHPLIYYTIIASFKSKVNETWVNTDDDEIAEVSKSIGAKIIKRPKELATDTSKSEESLLFFAKKVDFDILVFIQTTSPLLIASDINKGLDMMDKYDSVFSIYLDHWRPMWDEKIKPLYWDVYKRPMRQEFGNISIENGAFYITKRENLLKSKLRYSGKIGIVEMPFLRSFQVDTYEDLDLITKLIQKGFFKDEITYI